MDTQQEVFNHPLPSKEMARCGGIASMYRLPVQKDTTGLTACFVGIPFDNGSSYRHGARYAPRKIRCESVIVRQYNQDTGAKPFDSINVADIGDVNFNMFDIKMACADIKREYLKIIQNGCIPLTMGGDHTISYPILQAMKETYGPVGMVHIDAHSDTNDEYQGAKITHGTPFRRAVEENLLDCDRVVQIGLRGSGHTQMDCKWAIEQGFKIIPASKCWHRSMVPFMEEIRQQMGSGPVYLSFDIDGIDPAFAPGTGTPEIAGLTSIQALEIIRGCRGLNLIGADLVEVSPPYDHGGLTSVTAANLLFEMLCVIPGVKLGDRAFCQDNFKDISNGV